MVLFGSLSYYGCDYDGDGLSDLSVWEPKSNTLYFQLSSQNKFYEKRFFQQETSFQPVFADYDGDKKTDFAFYHQGTGQWILYLTTNPSLPIKTFLGNSSDVPIPATIDGDKKYEIAIWRPKNGAWVLTDKDKDGKVSRKIINFGYHQETPFAGDYDGDGNSDLAIWGPEHIGHWYIIKSSLGFDSNSPENIPNGQEWDTIVPNDYDGDGRCDLVLWRKSNQTWYFKYAKDGSQSELKFGAADDIPASGDIDGDGFPELVMWSPAEKKWNILNLKNQKVSSYKWDVPNGCLPAISVLQKFE